MDLWNVQRLLKRADHAAGHKEVLDSALAGARLCRVGAMKFAFGGCLSQKFGLSNFMGATAEAKHGRAPSLAQLDSVWSSSWPS